MPDAKPTGAQILAMTTRRRTRALVQKIVLVLLIVGGAGAFYWQRARSQQSSGPRYVTAAAKLAPLRETVTATGKFKGLDSVDVGAQISGRVARVLVDFNDQVRAGQTLAVLDPSTFQSRVAQSQADIAAGEASVRQAEATFANAQADFNRKKTLVDQGWSSPSALDQATAAMRTAQANVAAARARVNQSRAALRIQRKVFKSIVHPIP